MTTPRPLITTKSRGSASGSPFENNLTPTDIGEAAIEKIVIWHGDGSVYGFEVHYAGVHVEPIRHGGNSGTRAEAILEPEEIIKAVHGGGNGSSITHLTFITNKRVYGPYGSRTGEFFIWDVSNQVPKNVATRMGLLCFRGYADSQNIRLLQATFAEYPRPKQLTAQLNYERGPDYGENPELTGEASQQSPALLSKFATHLKSPVITLLVGPDQTTFHAYQDILCRLPFFRAALTGEFKESTDKAIKMPEDDPAVVAALVEYLYTGSYTYTYNAHSTVLETDNIPARDLSQGLFHVMVYAAASKYDCLPLVKGAVVNFFRVLKGLEGIEVVRLWKAAYAGELTMAKWGTEAELKSYSEHVTKLIAELYTEHKEEMETAMAEYPALAVDFLRLSGDGRRE